MSDKKFYRPGLIFKSKTSAHQEICRSKSVSRGMTGEVISEARELLAEFGQHFGEYSVELAGGERYTAASILGHFFDLDQQAEQKGWTAEEREIVAREMLTRAERRPGGDFSLYSKPHVSAPWPTYDSMPPEGVVSFAEAAGLVGEAILYEKQNAARKDVIRPLQAFLDEQAAASDVEGAFVAV